MGRRLYDRQLSAGKLRQTELVDWAESAMMDAEFGETDIEVLSDISRLGLPEPALSEAERVAEFGLRWRAVAGATFTEGGAERERTRLGNSGNRDSRVTISDCEEFLRRLGYRATVSVSSE